MSSNRSTIDTHTDPQVLDLHKKCIALQKSNAALHKGIAELRKEIDDYRTSTSWRLTQPLRDIAGLMAKRRRFIQLYNNYRYTYPNVLGFIRLVYKTTHTLFTGGASALRHAMLTSEKFIQAKALFNNALLFESTDTHDLNWLKTFQHHGLVVNPTLLFDHNGGGGTNTYTNTILKTILSTSDASALRIYPSDNLWFVQWVGPYNHMLFSTTSIDELFNALSLSNSKKIIINSLYGHPDLRRSASKIIELTDHLQAQLDFKINDFNALCPSPHLLNFENHYCGVPKDAQVCKTCLHHNQDWYHDWYPEENKPVNIEQWRTPFRSLFSAAGTITVFDASSIEILREAFDIEMTKIKLLPHHTDYFDCTETFDLSGPLHIASIGSLSVSKGAQVINDLYDYIQLHDMHIPITILGSSVVDLKLGIETHGVYTPKELPKVIKSKGINVVFMASIIPETFSYTLSEAMTMKLPIVAFDIGAQGNRVKQYEFGAVIPLDSPPKKILETIQAVLYSAQEQTK